MSYSTISTDETTNDYTDELLAEFVTAKLIAEADADINDVALSLGVLPTRIPTPCPNIVKKLSIAKVYNAVARDKSMMNTEGEDKSDAYELKRRIWAAEATRLEGLLTASALVGGATGAGGGLDALAKDSVFSFPMYRS